jgi:hypothetical protein
MWGFDSTIIVNGIYDRYYDSESCDPTIICYPNKMIVSVQYRIVVC